MKTPSKEELEEALNSVTEGMSPLQKALFVAKLFRKIYKEDWTIKCIGKDHFSIERKK